MNYPLKPVLTIRSLREQIALARTLQARQKVRQAEKYLHSQEKKLIECRNALCQQEEISLKHAVKRKISLSELESTQARLHGMKSIELGCRKDVNDAIDNVGNTQKIAERAKSEFYGVAKQKKKIEEHYQIWLEVEKINSEKALEEEMDEFTLQRRN